MRTASSGKRNIMASAIMPEMMMATRKAATPAKMLFIYTTASFAFQIYSPSRIYYKFTSVVHVVLSLMKSSTILRALSASRLATSTFMPPGTAYGLSLPRNCPHCGKTLQSDWILKAASTILIPYSIFSRSEMLISIALAILYSVHTDCRECWQCFASW